MGYVGIWTACPDGISTNITQIALASRPQGDVTLTCVLSGVRHEQVEYYWWLIQELNAPIFQYSVSFNTIWHIVQKRYMLKQVDIFFNSNVLQYSDIRTWTILYCCWQRAIMMSSIMVSFDKHWKKWFVNNRSKNTKSTASIFFSGKTRN